MPSKGAKEMNLSQFSVTDLEKYYKRKIECSKCSNVYGSDSPVDNGLCPLCCDKDHKRGGKK